MPDDQRPAPLVPAHVDLTDFHSMLLDCRRLRDSDRNTECTPEQNWAALLLWAYSWQQVPAASMPNNDETIAKQAGYQARGVVDPHWAAVRPGAMRGFVLCSDDRWYHPVVAEKAMEAWRAKCTQRHSTEKSRVKQHNVRHRCKVPFPELDAWIDAGCPTHPLPVTGDRYPYVTVTPAPAPAAMRSRPTETRVSANVTGDTHPPVTGDTPGHVTGDTPPESLVTRAPREEKVTTTTSSKEDSVVGGADAPAPPAPAPAPRKRRKRGDVPEDEPDVELVGELQVSPRPMRHCPRSFVVTEAMVLWANDSFPLLTLEELKAETRAFRNHRFVPGRERWRSTWENWIKTAHDRKTRNARPAAGAFTTSRERQVAAHLPGIAAPSAPPPRAPARSLNPSEVIDVDSRQPRIGEN